MTTILLERTPRAYLPEIPAYKAWLAQHHPDVRVSEIAAGGHADVQNHDIVWRFMGLDRPVRGGFVVHEYNSLSTGTLAYAKNFLKRRLNGTPQRRIFLSAHVRDGFGFRDNVPHRLRDMGVDEAFFKTPRAQIHDFIYAGSLNRGPVVLKVLDRFRGSLRGHSILLVGAADESLRARYADCPNIVFAGRVSYEQVPALMASARYGLNIMPDIYPFNRQTATKVLEYCALGLNVVSTHYRWISEFSTQRDAGFFWLDPNVENLTPDHLDGFAFRTPDVSDLAWDRIITQSGVFDFLR